MTQIDRDRKELGARIRAARKTTTHTLESAAAALTERGVDTSKGTVGHWETGERMLDAMQVIHLARLYGVTPDTLLWAEAPLSAEAMQLARQFDALDARYREHTKGVWLAAIKNLPAVEPSKDELDAAAKAAAQAVAKVIPKNNGKRAGKKRA